MYTEQHAIDTAKRMTVMHGKAQAIARLKAKLAAWTGDTRRDGDTPKWLWERALEELEQ